MTQPPSEGPGTGPEPQWAPPPPQWAPPPAPPQYGQPQYGQPQYGQPQYGQPQYGQPWAPPAAPQPDQGQWELLGGQPAPRRRAGGGRLLASAAVVVALVGGGTATYFAVSDSGDTGAASPREAVQQIFDDLNRSDLIGVLDDLAPAERTALANPARDSIEQLKRLKMLQGGADPGSVTGVAFRTEGLTFADETVRINDRVEIVQLTGGTITVGSDLAKVPFTKEFLRAAFPDGLPQRAEPETTNIADGVAGNGPVRLAAQKVDGRWYPSIVYTIVDNVTHDEAKTVTSGDAIPAKGSPTPQAAVEALVRALLQGDRAAAIALLSPDEMAAIHDYGRLLIEQGGYDPSDITLEDLRLTSTGISGGGRRVTLASVTLRKPGDGELTAVREGSCLKVTVDGDERRFCATDAAEQIASFVEGFGGPQLTQPQRTALAHLLAGVTDLGVEVSKTDGSWYVTPVRSVLDVMTSSLAGLQGDDLLEIVALLASLDG